MRTKLKLNLDQLNVDTFTTDGEARPTGTVFGEQCTCYTNCSCPGCPTCDASCNGTCGATCAGTCDYSCGGTCDFYCGGTVNDATCRNYGTCNPAAGYCPIVP